MPAATIEQIKEMGRRNRPAGAPGNQKGVFSRIHETLKVHTGIHQGILSTLQKGLIFEKQKEREEDAEAAAASLDLQGKDKDIDKITGPTAGMPAMPAGLKSNLLPLLLFGLGGVVVKALKGLVGGLSEVVKGLSWARFIRKFDFISDIGKLFAPLGTLFKNLPGMKGASAAAGAAGGALQSIIDIIPGGKWITSLLGKGLRAIPFVNALFGIFAFVDKFMTDYTTTEGTEGEKIIAGFGGGLEALVQFFVDDLLVFIQDGLAFAAKWLGFEGIGEKIKNFDMPDFSDIFAEIYEFAVEVAKGGEKGKQNRLALSQAIADINFVVQAGLADILISIASNLPFGSEAIVSRLRATKLFLANQLGVDVTRFPESAADIQPINPYQALGMTRAGPDELTSQQEMMNRFFFGRTSLEDMMQGLTPLNPGPGQEGSATTVVDQSSNDSNVQTSNVFTFYNPVMSALMKYGAGPLPPRFW